MGVLKMKVGGIWTPVAQGVGIASPGLVGYAQTNTQAVLAVSGPVAGLSVTFTAIAGHTYLYQYKVTAQKDATAASIWAELRSASEAVVDSAFHSTIGANQRFPLIGWAMETFSTTGSQTRKMNVNFNAGTVTVQPGADYSKLVVYDITTATMDGLATPWTGVTFQNGWVNFGGAYQTAQYRKVGDVVQVRGVIKSGTVGSIAFTLPVGFRPPAKLQIGQESNQVHSYVEVDTAGQVIMTLASPSAANVQLSFSTI
jgi:hypothetical protein